MIKHLMGNPGEENFIFIPLMVSDRFWSMKGKAQWSHSGQSECVAEAYSHSGGPGSRDGRPKPKFLAYNLQRSASSDSNLSVRPQFLESIAFKSVL